MTDGSNVSPPPTKFGDRGERNGNRAIDVRVGFGYDGWFFRGWCLEQGGLTRLYQYIFASFCSDTQHPLFHTSKRVSIYAIFFSCISVTL